eukprot:TRINITY_DN4760_c0_g1_i1.p2 TRINITY_DN4760_c0_g1~~TRINITY_DN4760_c0_g1_i1.p2  ORF type:complete len:135 (-),score=34.65 TRINITY_DN4760_c0_g1_i1:259-663(-)
MGNTACCSEDKAALPVETAVAAPSPPDESEQKPADEPKSQSETGPKEPALVLTFELPDKTMKEIRFEESPLGIDFSRSLPLVVKRLRPNTCGDKLGVQSDWVVALINGSPVPATFEEALDLLKKAVIELKQMPS